MQLSVKEESVKAYLNLSKGVIHSGPGGAYVVNIYNNKIVFFIKRKEFESISQKLKQFERIQKILKIENV